jgi:hypothetical protein
VEQGLHSQEVVALPLSFFLDEIFSLLVDAFHIFDFFVLFGLLLLFLFLLLLQSILTTLNVKSINLFLVSLLSEGFRFSSFDVAVFLYFLVSKHIVHLLLFLFQEFSLLLA